MTWIDCTGDVCKGDLVKFTESVFGGSHRRPQHLGKRVVIAKVVSDSYGEEKQQHTFSLVVVESSGFRALEPGVKARRKGRNVYRNGTERQLWGDEGRRRERLKEKHQRGGVARSRRADALRGAAE